jgi:hypothetical protein
MGQRLKVRAFAAARRSKGIEPTPDELVSEIPNLSRNQLVIDAVPLPDPPVLAALIVESLQPKTLGDAAAVTVEQ